MQSPGGRPLGSVLVARRQAGARSVVAGVGFACRACEELCLAQADGVSCAPGAEPRRAVASGAAAKRGRRPYRRRKQPSPGADEAAAGGPGADAAAAAAAAGGRPPDQAVAAPAQPILVPPVEPLAAAACHVVRACAVCLCGPFLLLGGHQGPRTGRGHGGSTDPGSDRDGCVFTCRASPVAWWSAASPSPPGRPRATARSWHLQVRAHPRRSSLAVCPMASCKAAPALVVHLLQSTLDTLSDV